MDIDGIPLDSLEYWQKLTACDQWKRITLKSGHPIAGDRLIGVAKASRSRNAAFCW